MKVKHFSEIEDEFIRRVHSAVWCSFATVDSRQRPRSRILHPLWEGSTGWILTYRNSHKSKHLSGNPYVSLAYIADVAKPVYVDCTARWADDLGQKEHVWELFANAPPPLGYDPAPIFVSADHENLGLLQLTPWRIAVVSFPAESHDLGECIWRNREASQAFAPSEISHPAKS